jgi:hypothetical protein
LRTIAATLAKVYRDQCDDPVTQEFFETFSTLFCPNYGPLTAAELVTDAFERLALLSSPNSDLLLPVPFDRWIDGR